MFPDFAIGWSNVSDLWRAEQARAERAEVALREILDICLNEPDAVAAATRAADVAADALPGVYSCSPSERLRGPENRSEGHV